MTTRKGVSRVEHVTCDLEHVTCDLEHVTFKRVTLNLCP
ncbi:hypothetical protein EYF80_065311 [Liparis tanakae]|uniref:Uncharacterized protein n=1 Tax=Liparis tanakae TaxID=230148 RepID=A0A4Z2E7D9_9TELE|nr:hypothetical protein EYF80_065311 [Liparis tanakae]